MTRRIVLGDLTTNDSIEAAQEIAVRLKRMKSREHARSETHAATRYKPAYMGANWDGCSKVFCTSIVLATREEQMSEGKE